MKAGTSHRLELDVGPAEAPRAVAAAASAWGAEWVPDASGGRLDLPVSAGLRRGRVLGTLRISAQDSGSRLDLQVDEARFAVRRSAAAVLALGAAGGVVNVLWPIFPQLLPLAPVGVILALVAWLLVASQLRSAGVEEFLEAIAVQTSGGSAASSAEPPRGEATRAV